MNRFWLKQYPVGVPADVDVHQYSSLIELFEESFATFVDRKAAICMDKAITYGELDGMSAAIGAYLQSRGLAKGARVAVMMPNVLQNPVALTAGLRAGYTVVNVNPLYTPCARRRTGCELRYSLLMHRQVHMLLPNASTAPYRISSISRTKLQPASLAQSRPGWKQPRSHAPSASRPRAWMPMITTCAEWRPSTS